MAIHINQSSTWTPISNALVNISNTWTQVKSIYVNNAGVWTLAWQNEVQVTLASQSTSVNLRSLFDATTWASSTPKRVIVPAGVNINANNWLGALYLDAGTAWGGNLVVDIAGALYGIGGVYLSNSGEGGAGIGSAITGASGQRITVNLLAGGIIKAGGGAGGLGGQGGAGSYAYTSYDSGYIYNYGSEFWQATRNLSYVYWGGSVVGIYDVFATSATNGASTYYKGSAVGGQYYYIRRVDTATGSTSGGAGGYGGRGQGADGTAASGVSGTAGGTNAGTGGAGGTGSAWGAQGGTGSAGSAGNAGSGAAGAAGGLGGRYAYGYLTFNNSGTTAGRLALT